MERNVLLLAILVVTVAVGCASGETEPDTASCQVITGLAEPTTVMWPLRPDNSTEPMQEVTVAELVRVRINYTANVLDVSIHDASADGAGTISWYRASDGEHLQDVSRVGDTIADVRAEHPGTRQGIRVLCEAA